MWRDELDRCIRIETEQVALLRTLINGSHDPERLRAYSELLAAKVEVLTILNTLLRYSDRSEQ